MKVKYTAILLFLSILLNQTANAQCDYTINAVVTQHSIPCARDGIITVTLTGPDVESGNISLDGAQYGIISAIAGGNNIAQSANGGIITQVPPGTYQVQVTATCKIGNKPVPKTSEVTITVDGNYSPPNPVGIIYGGIVAPFKCDSTGAISVNVSGGLPPYKLTVTNNNGYSQVFDVVSEGDITISDLPAGYYTFSLKDNCGYFPSSTEQQLDAVNESFYVDWSLPANCKAGGSFPVYIYDGKPPFTIIAASDGYSDTIVVPATGNYSIDDLPAGNYIVTVKDACDQSREFYYTIDKITGNAYIQQVSNSPDCGTGSGQVVLGIWGEAPFTIDITSDTDFEGTFSAIGDTAFTNLKPGNYTFKVIDDCNDTITLTQKIDEVKLDTDDDVVTTDVDGSGGSATIRTTGGVPWIIESISATISGSCTNSYILPMTVYSPDTTLLDLCAGKYKIIVSDTCDNKDSTTFTINLKPITSSPVFGGEDSGYEWIPCPANENCPDRCDLTTKITLPLSGGSGYYELYFIKHPGNPAATPENPVPIDTVDTSPAIAVIPKLTPGDYEILIVDAVSFSRPFYHRI